MRFLGACGQNTCIWVSPGDRSRLERLVSDRNTPQKHVWRARIVLLSWEGLGTMEIMRRVGKSKPTVWRWQQRYLAAGVDGLLRDRPRGPGKPALGGEVISLVLTKTLGDKPPKATHWSLRTMAKAVGIGHSSVQRIWAKHGLKPHLVSTFKVSNDPQVGGEGSRRGRPLSEPAGQGAGVFDGREEPDPGARPHPTRAADEEGPRRHHDPRLQAQWHDHAVSRR